MTPEQPIEQMIEKEAAERYPYTRTHGNDIYHNNDLAEAEQDAYIAGRTKSIEREKELVEILKAIVSDWVGEDPFKSEPEYRVHSDKLIKDFGYWSPSSKNVKAELIFKAKQLITKNGKN